MGMYDSVYVKCPHCNIEEELQSKVGNCMLAEYTDDIPLIIAKDLANDIHICERCKQKYAVDIKYTIRLVPRVLRNEFERKTRYEN